MSKARSRRRRSAAQASQPEFRRSMLWAAVIVSAIGIALALYSIEISFKIAGQGLVESSGCSMGEFINCDMAHASSYSKLLGIPVAGWGLAFYIFAGLSALSGLFLSNRRLAGGWIAFAWILSIGAVLFSVLKAYNLVELGVLCLVCLGMYLVNLALVFLLPAGLNAGGMGALFRNWVSAARGTENDLPFDARVPRWALVALVVFGLGFVFMKKEVDTLSTGEALDMDLALAAHYRQTPVDVRVDPNAALWGTADGAVQVVEFADFQCPACQVSAFHLRPALFEFRDRLSFRFMNYPLDADVNNRMQRQVHAQAGEAAAAGVCAQQFGDFWDYHDDLFRNQLTLGPQLYERLAEDRGWSVDDFTACMESDETLQRIQSDIAAGQDAGLSSTPTIYINGRKIAFWQNNDFITEVIRTELDRAG